MHLYIPVWIDLKKKPSAHSTAEFFTLHSSMDRFKGGDGVLEDKDKEPLHSSMDRFKVCICTQKEQ